MDIIVQTFRYAEELLGKKNVINISGGWMILKSVTARGHKLRLKTSKTETLCRVIDCEDLWST